MIEIFFDAVWIVWIFGVSFDFMDMVNHEDSELGHGIGQEGNSRGQLDDWLAVQ